MTNDSVRLLTNEQLLADVATVAGRERETLAQLIVLLSEIDSRRLYLGEGYSSLFTFCTQRLRLSEHAAYGRIEAARAARKFPAILDLLVNGSITLTAVCLLSRELTSENHQALLEAARHKSKREVEQLVAAMRPLPAVPSLVRRQPDPKRSAVAAPAASTSVSPASCATGGDLTPKVTPAPPRPAPAVVLPLAPERYKVQLTIDAATHDKLRQVQDLLRHVVPSGDPAAIFDRALTALLHDLKRRKLAQVTRPRQSTSAPSSSRHVPAAVRREVWSRDGGQCAFVGARGRCAERGFLEFHHVMPFAQGGPTTSENLQLRCAAHNRYESGFGPIAVRESRPTFELGPDRAGDTPSRHGAVMFAPAGYCGPT